MIDSGATRTVVRAGEPFLAGLSTLNAHVKLSRLITPKWLQVSLLICQSGLRRVRTGLTCKLNLPYFCGKKREEGLFLHLVSNLKSDLNYLFPFGSFNPLRKVNIRRRGLDYALA